MTVRYEHGWQMAELPDGTTLYRTTVTRHRDDMVEPTWQQRIMMRARYKIGAPQPNTPERFYHQERFG